MSSFKASAGPSKPPLSVAETGDSAVNLARRYVGHNLWANPAACVVTFERDGKQTAVRIYASNAAAPLHLASPKARQRMTDNGWLMTGIQVGAMLEAKAKALYGAEVFASCGKPFLENTFN